MKKNKKYNNKVEVGYLKKSVRSNKILNNMLIWLLTILITIVPLIVYLKVLPIEGTTYGYNTGSIKNYDFFSYYKMIWIIVITTIIILIFVLKNYKNKQKLKNTKLYIPIGIYSLCAVLSTLFSPHKKIALFGYVERYEGMLVLLAYMIMLIVAINSINRESDIKNLISLIFISTIIISIVGIFQYFGKDLFMSNIGKKMILSASYDNLASSLKPSFEPGTFYSTLYHYNYVGSYMAMLFPMALTLLLLVKSRKQKLILCFLTIVTFLSLLMSKSRAGIIGIVFALIMIIILFRKYIIKKWPYYLAGLMAAFVCFFSINMISNGGIIRRLALLTEDIKVITSNKEMNKLKNLVIDEDKVSILGSDNTLNMVFINENIQYFDTNNQNIIVTYDESNGEMTFKDERYKNYIFKLTYESNIPIIQMRNSSLIGANILNFAITNEGFKYINHRGNIVDLKPVQSFGFEGKETIGSARGYIWSRSIPLLKSSLIIGKGPDTFAESFPQNDYIGKLIAYGTPNMFVDKPHNLFLQTGINTGVISLFAMLALFIMYLAECLKLYLKCNFDNLYKIAGASIFVAVCGYLGAAFFNDSVVSVAPVFWVLLGVGISINLKLKEMKKIEN